MAKHSRSNRIEKQEIAVLNLLLNDHPLLTQLTGGDDNVPLVDGYVHLLGEQEEVDGDMLKVQVKPLKANKDGSFSATCDVGLLSHAHSSSLPVLLIGVDVEGQTAYWSYLAPEGVRPLYEAQMAAGKKTATLRLPNAQVIRKGVDAYVEEWKRICLHHKNSSNDRLAARYKRRIKRNLLTANEDALLERIRTLHDIGHYRTSKGEFPLIEIVLELARVIGETSATVKIAYIELLEQVVYEKTAEALEPLAKLALDESEQVQKKAKEALKNVSKYNYHVLNAFGYAPYRTALDFIRTHDLPGELVHEMLRNLLGPDFDGTSQSDMYTLTFHQGPLDATPFLKKLRRDAIELLLERYRKETSVSEKAKSIESIGHATYKSDSPFPSDPDFLQRSIEMVEADTEFVVSQYKEVLFSGDGKMTSVYPVVYEVESQLSVLNTRANKPAGVEDLLKRIREDKSDYRLFSLLAGDEMRLRRDVEWNEGQKQKEEELKEVLNSITAENAGEWYKRIDAVARFHDSIDDWLFQTLRDFIAQIAEQKPQVATVFAEQALKNKEGLFFFFRSILWGFRKGGAMAQWDEYANRIAKEKLTEQVEGILMSYLANGTDPRAGQIRPEDIALVLEIAKQEGRFSFLKTSETNRRIEYHVIRVLAFLSTIGVELRKALVAKIKNYPELDTMYSHELGFALHCKWIKLDEWDKEDMEALATMLVQIKRLEHYEVQVLHAIGVVDFDLMMSIFERRIKHPYHSGYDAIPNHFEGGALTFIRDHPRLKSAAMAWLQEMDLNEKTGLVAYHLGEFFQHVGGTALREVLSGLIATGEKQNLLKVIDMLPLSDPADPSLCLEIVAVTDDEKILARIDHQMRKVGGGTGVVGENIFAREMRKNQARINDIKSKATDPKIISFCERVLANLALDIARSEQEHEREMREEREEYEEEHP